MSSEEKNRLSVRWNSAISANCSCRGLHRILRMIVDRAERLIAQGSGAKVVHERRIQRRRVDVSPGMPRSRTTLVADGSPAMLMLGGSGRTMRMVACSVIREVPERRRRDHREGRADHSDRP